jgi:hypothetical protein
MEYENHYSSKSQANLNTVLGALGTAAFVGAGTGGLGGIFGNRTACSEDHCVNRYEFGLQQEIAAKDARIGLLESNIYTDAKIADVYERLNAKIGGVEAQLSAQAVYNATNTATINCISGQVAQLMSLTKLVVPNTSICPGWGDVTVSVTPAPTTAG